MNLRSFIEPKLSPIPSSYKDQLGGIYYNSFGTKVCSGCSGLWIRLLVSFFEARGQYLELLNGKVEIKDIQKPTLSELVIIELTEPTPELVSIFEISEGLNPENLKSESDELGRGKIRSRSKKSTK